MSHPDGRRPGGRSVTETAAPICVACRTNPTSGGLQCDACLSGSRDADSTTLRHVAPSRRPAAPDKNAIVIPAAPALHVEAEPAPAMNRTEALHAARLSADPDVERFEFNAVRLRLADGAWYKPDFWVLYRDGHEEMHEVKMRWWSRDRVRVKVAARLYGWRWTFRVFQKAREKDGGAWSIETMPSDSSDA